VNGFRAPLTCLSGFDARPPLAGSVEARKRGPCRTRLLGGGSFFVPLGVREATSRTVETSPPLIAILDPNAVANGVQTLPPESTALTTALASQ
jgi:hypothetical protein